MMRIDDFYEFLQHQAASFYDSKNWAEIEMETEDWFEEFSEFVEAQYDDTSPGV